MLLFRSLLYGPVKLRALWRIVIFFAVAAVCFLMLYGSAATLAPYGLVAQLAAYSLVMSIALLVASWLMMFRFERRPFTAIGLPWGRDAWAGWLHGAAIGGGFMAALVLFQIVPGWLRPVFDTGTLDAWLGSVAGLGLLLAVAAFAEELCFRGYAFQVLVEAAGPFVAVVVSSVAFAAVHLNNPGVGPLSLLNLGLAGVLLAVAYLRTRSLWFATGLHWAWNWVQTAVFDLPVSGLEFDVPLYDTARLGPESMTGGVFGLEGSILLALLMPPLIVWMARTQSLSESAAVKALDPLVDSRLRTELKTGN